MPSWRPCSSITLKFMNRCAGSVSSLKSADFMAICVWSRTSAISASSSPPAPKRSPPTRSTKPAAYSGSGTQWRRSFCGSDFSSSCTFSLSMPGTSHSQRRASTWFSA